MDVDITPPTAVYATFSRLNYRPWYALAELVDNATQSYDEHRADLLVAGSAGLEVAVVYEPTAARLRVRDDAYGMDDTVLERALSLSAPPPDRSGRSEFGMGLKTASCWFSPRWRLTTTRLGSPLRHSVLFDVKQLVESRETALRVRTEPAAAEDHGTTVVLEDLHRQLHSSQVKRCKELLSSIYRADLGGDRSGPATTITWNGRPLSWEAPRLWCVLDGEGVQRPLRQELDVEVTDPVDGARHRARGWVGVLDTMNARDSGFTLLRRGRVVLGGPGEGWKPKLFGASSTFENRRLARIFRSRGALA